MAKIKLSKLRGMSLSILKIEIDNMTSQISFLTIGWKADNGVCYSGTYRSFAFISIPKNRDNGGVSWSLRVGLFFRYWVLKTWVIIPEKDRCINCGDLCETKEFYKNNEAYCCEFCK